MSSLRFAPLALLVSLALASLAPEPLAASLQAPTEALPPDATSIPQALVDSAGALLVAAGEAAQAGSSELALCYLSGTASLDRRILTVDFGALEDGTGFWKALEALPRERWAEPPPAEGTGSPVLRVGGNITPPRKLKVLAPQYTVAGREARVQGIVILEAVIGASGQLERTRLLKGLPHGLAAQAMLALCNWEFAPATLNGEPVAVYYTLTINFQLEKEAIENTPP